MIDQFYSLFGRVAQAAEFDPTGVIGEETGFGNQDPVVSALNILQIVLGVVGLVFVVLVIVGGFMWMTSAGNEERIKKARKLLISAVIGLAIILGSYGISEYAFNVLFEATGGTPGIQPSTSDQDGDSATANPCLGKTDGAMVTGCEDGLVCYNEQCMTGCEYLVLTSLSSGVGFEGVCQPVTSCSMWMKTVDGFQFNDPLGCEAVPGFECLSDPIYCPDPDDVCCE